MALTAALLYLVGYGYLTLVGAAAAPFLLPRRWLPLAPLAVPLLGWAVLVAVGYPLNAVLPFRTVALLIGAGAVLVLLGTALGREGNGPGGRGRRPRRSWREWRAWRGWRIWAREAGPALLLGLAVYAVAAAVHIRQGALTALVVDSDVEHFADVVAALLRYPIGLDVAGQQGLEATPVGLAYHAVHATLSGVSGRDAFVTALPSHFLMLSLAVGGVTLFSRTVLGLTRGTALVASVLYAFGALPLVVAAFGWGQQTAALATVPVALAALRQGLSAPDRRSLWTAGLLAALASGSLYLASAPLVGGVAAVLALALAVRRRTLVPLWRLLGVGAIVAAAGLLSHVSAAAFLRERVTAGLLRPDELSGRSTHVFDFAPAAALAGVAPLTLFRDVLTLAGEPLLRWPEPAGVAGALATAGAVLLVCAGVALAPRRASPALPAVLGVVILYWAYLRLVRPFPYGEFKLLTTVWFLVPVLAVAGWVALSSRARPVPVAPSLASLASRAASWATPPVASVALAAYALGLGLTWGHTLRFLSLPWGATLPESVMADAHRVAGALPAGSSVYVSGQLVAEATLRPEPALTGHRAGFSSPSARAGYLTKRWQGAVTSLLAFGGHPVYGLVQRHSTELRAPASPQATDFLLLDALEDPRLSGALPADLVASAGSLRLYRRGDRPFLLPADLPADLPAGAPLRLRAGATALTAGGAMGAASREEGEAEALPAPVLPIGESLPGRRQGMAPAGRNQGSAVRAAGASRAGAVQAARGQLLLGFHALEVTRIRLHLRQPNGETVRRDLVVTPGLTWYATPEVSWPVEAEVTVAGEAAADGQEDQGIQAGWQQVRVVAAQVLSPDGLGETLERSRAGTEWPLLTFSSAVGAGGITLDAWYTYFGPREGSVRVRLRDATELWIGGQTTPGALHLGPGARRWRVTLSPGAPPRQTVSDGRPVPSSGAWDRAPGRRWLWLEVGPERGAALHEPALASIDLRGSGGGVRPRVTGEAVAQRGGAVILPLLAEAAEPPAVQDGTLVKGSAEELFYVDRGKLRWVADTGVLERYRIPWRLMVLEDVALWRLPVGLPLT